MNVNAAYKMVKDLAPGAIHKTERDTYVFTLDGEQHVHGSPKSAASDLARALGLGTRHVTTQELRARLTIAEPVVIQTSHGEAALTAPAPTQAAPRKAVSITATAGENGHATGHGTRSRRPVRATTVELPQRVLAELLRSGRANVRLTVR